MRTGLAAVLLLLLLLVVFVTRSGDDESAPVAPDAAPDRTSPVVGPAPPDEETGAGPAATGRIRFRFVTREGEDAPPVPGAVVTLYRRTFEGWVEVGRAVADGDGRVEIGGLPKSLDHDDRIEGIAGAEGRARTWLWMPHPMSSPKEEVVVLPPAEPLAGRVLDAMTGGPVAGAQVETRDQHGIFIDRQHDISPGPILDRAETGVDGAFRLPSFGDLLQVTAAGYATARKSMGRSEGPVTIRLSPGAALAGRVTDARGRPVAGATVLASPTWASTHGQRPPTEWRLRRGSRFRFARSGGGLQDVFTADGAKTDADGRYRIPGLTAREEYYAWGLVGGQPRTRLTVVRASGLPRDLRLVRPATLTVRLARPDREGVLVTLAPKDAPGWEFRARNEAGDVVRVEGIVPGTYDVRVVPQRYRTRTLVLTLTPGEDATREIPAREEEKSPDPPETVTVTGVVVDDRGAPLVEAWVSCEGADEQDKLTDAGGGFWFRKPGRRFPEMAAEAEGYVTERISGWWIDGSRPIRFVLHRLVRVRIPLRIPDGATMPKMMRLVIRDPRGSSLEELEVESGRLVVPVRAGATLIRLQPETFLPVDLPLPGGADADRETAPVLLDPGATIRFLVVDTDGRAIRGATVDVRQRGVRHCRGGTTDENGRVRVTGLFPGEAARAIVFAREFAVAERAGVRPGAEAPVEFRLPGVVILRGTIVYDDGHPAGAVRVEAYRLVEGRDDDFEGSVYADNAGRFRIALAPGDYRMVFAPPTAKKEGEVAERTAVVTADGENEHRFEIPRPR